MNCLCCGASRPRPRTDGFCSDYCARTWYSECAEREAEPPRRRSRGRRRCWAPLVAAGALALAGWRPAVAEAAECRQPKVCVDPRAQQPAQRLTGCADIKRVLTDVLAQTPCGDCPPKAVLRTVLDAPSWHPGKGRKERERARALIEVRSWLERSFFGFCPGVPSTGRLAMELRGGDGEAVELAGGCEAMDRSGCAP